MRRNETPVTGKLFMFIFAVFLILVLMSGGKAFAAGTCETIELPNTPGVVEYGECEMSTGELAEMEETESGPVDESMETETSTPQGAAGMAEGTTGTVPAPVHGSGSTDVAGAPRHVARNPRRACRRTKGHTRRNPRCRSRRHRKVHSQKGH